MLNDADGHGGGVASEASGRNGADIFGRRHDLQTFHIDRRRLGVTLHG